MKPMTSLKDFLEPEMVQHILDRTDEALKAVTRAIALLPQVIENTITPDLHVGFFAIDLMFDEASNDVRLLDFNAKPGAAGMSIWTDEIHGFPPVDYSRMILTAFQQFHLKNDRFDMNACVEQYPNWKKLNFS